MTSRSRAISPPTVTSDLAARRILAVARVTIAFAVAVLTSVETIDAPQWYAWLAGLAWLPFASWMWFAEEGPASAARARLGYVADVAMIGLTIVALPEHADLVAASALPLAVIVAYRDGPLPGAGLLAATVMLRLGFHVIGGTATIDLVALLVEAIGTLAIVVLIGRAIAVQHRDATSARHFAERSDLILSRSSESIIVTDSGGNLLQANTAAINSLVERDVEITSLHCGELALETEGGPLDCTSGCALAALCADGSDVEVVHPSLDGTDHPFLANASRLPGTRGKGPEFVHSFRDITRLRQADEAKTMFLATASHELKTPLTVIRGFTQILRSTATDEQSRVALDAIESRSSELVKIVDRLLLSSRIEAGRVELIPSVIDVSELVQERMVPLGNTLGRTLDLEFDEQLHAIGSAEALSTALEHVLDNAAKYSPDGGPISIRASRGEDRSGTPEVRVAITDKGIGMTPEQASHCFEKFWQAEATDVRRFGGTGIGLYIVHSLVTGMGGQISVESRLGGGSTFTITLPTVSVDEDAPDVDAPVEGEAAVQGGSAVDEFMAHLGFPQRTPT